MQRYFVVIWFFFSAALYAAIPPIEEIRHDPYQRFELFDQWPDQEHGVVTDILQDTTGYLWFATTNGLYRYDGMETRKYIKDWTPQSLPDSYVNDLALDQHSNLMVATKNGLCIYSPLTDSFIPLYTPLQYESPSDTFNIRAIHCNLDSTLWIDSQAGILSLIHIPNKIVLEQYAHPAPYQPYYLYHALAIDKYGIVWLGGRGNGPFILDEITQKIHYYRKIAVAGEDIYERKNDAAVLFVDPLGDLWMGSLSGLYIMQGDSMQSFTNASCYDIICSKSGEYWFGLGDQLGRYDPQNKHLTCYDYNEENLHSLPGKRIYKIFEDHSGRIWVSTNNGLAYTKPYPKGTQPYYHIPAMHKTLASNKITQIAHDHKNGIWISTKHHGIDHLNIETEEIRHYSPDNVAGMLSGNVRCFTQDQKGHLYLGFWSGTGFGRLDPATKRYQNFALNPRSRNTDWYNDMLFDASGNLYLGFWGAHGLTIFDTTKQEFRRFLREKFRPEFNARLITCLHRDNENNIWMGTTQAGLHKYIPKMDTAISYFKPTNPHYGIADDHIYDITTCMDTSILIAGSNLYLKKKHADTLSLLHPTGLPENALVYKILPHNDTLVWLLSNQGTWSYNPHSNTARSQKHLISLTYTETTAAADIYQHNIVVFGGLQGLVVLNIRDIEPPRSNKFQLFFSHLEVFDNTKFHQLITENTYNLKHRENFFTINMGGFDNKNTETSYLLEGFQNKWITLNFQNAKASFTNVPPGEYTFKIRLTSNDTHRVLQQKVLYLNILPPWYQQGWFIISSVLLLTFIATVFIRNRLLALRLRISMAEMNQKLLRLQMNPHFIFNSLYAIQNYIYSNQTHLAGEYLSDFSQLIRKILNNSRVEQISIHEEEETVELYLKLQKLRFGEKLAYSLMVDPRLYHEDVYVPPMLIQPFIENAIEHGIKNLDRTGYINIKYLYQDENIIFDVIDNGIGLTAAKKITKEKKHKSLATAIVKQRLEIIRKKTDKPTKLSIREIKGDDGSIAGTHVKLIIPIQTSQS